MPRTRVLVVEDSPTVRRRICDILQADSGIDLIGEAADGLQAIELCEAAKPDVVTMDMMLPKLTGLQATEHIMARCPTPILIVSASVNRGELFRTYDALAAGAVDVLEKPTGTEPDGAWERKLVSMVKLVGRIQVVTRHVARSNRLAVAATERLTRRISGPACEIVAIGASTGGPAAIVEILRGLPPSFRLPIVFVLHLNEVFGAAFPDWLGAQTGRVVTFARDGEPVVAASGRVIMAPAGEHVVVRSGRLHRTRGPERHSCRPSIDVLFDSVAEDYGPRAAACLLTGMGRDGAQGLLAVRGGGGFTIAQDEASSVIYGMPREASLLGAAERVLPLDEIAPALLALEAMAETAR